MGKNDYYSGYLKEKKKNAKFEVNKLPSIYNEIFVYSLEKHIGTTHMAASYASLLSRYDDVALISNDLVSSQIWRDRMTSRKVEVVSDISDTTRKVNYIVHDCGVIDKKKFNYKPLSANIIVCDMSYEFLHKLAEFLADEPSASKLIYYFNIVPETDKSEMKRIMTAYSNTYFGGELFSAANPSDEIKKLLLKTIAR